MKFPQNIRTTVTVFNHNRNVLNGYCIGDVFFVCLYSCIQLPSYVFREVGHNSTPRTFVADDLKTCLPNCCFYNKAFCTIS